MLLNTGTGVPSTEFPGNCYQQNLRLFCHHGFADTPGVGYCDLPDEARSVAGENILSGALESRAV